MTLFVAGAFVGAALALLLLARRIYRVGVVDGKESVLGHWERAQKGEIDGR